MQFNQCSTSPFRLLLLLPMLLLSICTRADEYDLLPIRLNRDVLKLHGNVTSMKEQKWVLTFDTAIYNTAPTIQIDSSFLLVRTEEAGFNEKGDILKLETHTLSDPRKNKMTDSSRYFYYKKDKIISIINSADGKNTDSFEFHYNKKGLPDYYRLFDANGNLQYKITYVYKDKKVFTIRKKNEDNFAISMIKFFYKNNKLSECQYFDDQFKHIETRRFASKKNSDGNIDESYSVSDGNNVLKGGVTLLKDSLGNILEQSIVDSNRNVSAYYSFRYDQHNNKTLEKVFIDFQKQQTENRYTYDAQNNWIKKEIFTDDVLTAIITRDLHYE